jgi:hypothetical protein
VAALLLKAFVKSIIYDSRAKESVIDLPTVARDPYPCLCLSGLYRDRGLSPPPCRDRDHDVCSDSDLLNVDRNHDRLADLDPDHRSENPAHTACSVDRTVQSVLWDGQTSTTTVGPIRSHLLLLLLLRVKTEAPPLQQIGLERMHWWVQLEQPLHPKQLLQWMGPMLSVQQLASQSRTPKAPVLPRQPLRLRLRLRLRLPLPFHRTVATAAAFAFGTPLKPPWSARVLLLDGRTNSLYPDCKIHSQTQHKAQVI